MKIKYEINSNQIISVCTQPDGISCGIIEITVDNSEWLEVTGRVELLKGEHAIYFVYEGTGVIDFVSFTLL